MNKVIINDFAPFADKFAVVPATGSTAFYNTNNLVKTNERELINYASLTGIGIDLLDNSLVLADESDNIGYISADISNSNRRIFPYVDIMIDLSESGVYYSSPGVTLHFFQNYSTEFSIRWYQDDINLQWLPYKPSFSEEEKKNKILTFFAEGHVEHFNKILISFGETEGPNQFIKLAGIDIGKERVITDFYSNIDIFAEIEPDCLDVPASTCDFVAKVTEFKPQDMQELYVYGKDKLFGKYVIDRAPSVGENLYSFECSDEILKMDTPKTKSALSEKTVQEYKETIEEISNVEINCDECISESVDGFIEEKTSARKLAGMLSFATGCYLSGFAERNLRFFKARNRKNKVISASQILGKAEYTPQAPYTEIELIKYYSTFDEKSDSRLAPNFNLKSNQLSKPLIIDKYSLMKNIDEKMAEITASGFYRNEIIARILYKDEALGDICSIETPYDGLKTGIIKNLGISIGNRITATVTMIERDFASSGGGD